MASQLVSKGEREELGNMFKSEDKNGDGYLDKAELLVVFKRMGYVLTDKELDDLFEHVDIDGSGKIAYSEFIAAAVDSQSMLTDQKLKKAFQIFDKDKSGSIEAGEIHLILGGATEVSMQEIIKQVDSNQDGKVSYDEFKTMMKNQAAI